jgi:sensor histidine kinase YesM
MVQILRLYILSIILKLIKKDEINLSTKEWAMISVLLLISVILFMCIHSVQLNRYTGSYNNIFLFLSKLGLIVINISAFNMIVALSKSNKTKNELIILKQIYDHQKEHADDVKRKNEEIRKIRHDITHIISVIQAFIEKNNIDGLSAYLNKLPLDSNSFDFNIDTKNDYVNGILNNKLSKAKSKGIKVLCSMPKHITGVDDIDLCVLLGNIIDNAIEACEKCLEGKYIEVSTRMNENNIFIEVYNTISMPFKDISFKTQKEDKDNHGYGIKSIKEIVSRYDGYLDYSNDAGLICCSVILNKN